VDIGKRRRNAEFAENAEETQRKRRKENNGYDKG
jgi:hypothetical protein